MRSKWITFNNKEIFYQDFSNLGMNSDSISNELSEVSQIVAKQPENSVFVLADFRGTIITTASLSIFMEASKTTQKYIKKTAVLGVDGMKKIIGNSLVRATGQQLNLFSNEEEAKKWLTQ
jgi:hypothetical protein